MLWIAVYLPHLPLELFLRGTRAPEPFAVAQGGLILDCDRKAASRGVKLGMAVTTASALAPNLIVRQRDPAAETEALLGLAAWAVKFTPAVSVELPDAVLLEISGSLQLFGGLERIMAALRTDLEAMGYGPLLSCAPVPLAAYWMARTREQHCLADATTLDSAVKALPLAVMNCDIELLEALQGIGAATLGDLLSLPRDGMARRFGPALLDQLDRALGRAPDARTLFRPPATFQASIELPVEVSQAEALLFAARRLLVQLSGFLAARSSGVQRIAISLRHRESATQLPIGLVAPSRDSAHFTLLLRERLASFTLREPVRAITVTARDILPLPDENQALFIDDSAAPGNWEKLIERLRARLGAQSVHGLAPTAEHRPERASATADITAQGRAGPAQFGPAQLPLFFGERPFWLLDQPEPIREIDSSPHRGGPLELLAGPECIESGWWEGTDGDVKRDYFIARSPERSLLWIYRERRALDSGAGWYLHGIFA